MSTFHLKVLTIDRVFFDGEVERAIVRTTEGDVGILPNHISYLAALGIGSLTILNGDHARIAAIAGGFVDISKESTVILARTCEWADEIDLNRAREAEERAKALIHQKRSDTEHDLAALKLKKAINRIRIAQK